MLRADYVFHTGAETVQIPLSMGTARYDQMQGSNLDQLGELACRICYDSLGKGRSSQDLHKHVRDVINLSVYEHLVVTVFINDPDPMIGLALLNRPNLHVRIVSDGYEITANLRHLYEWDLYTQSERSGLKLRSYQIASALESLFTSLAPLAYPVKKRNGGSHQIYCGLVPRHLLHPEQKMLSIRLYGSRGFSHEMVRHRRAGISQRSTRYTDEAFEYPEIDNLEESSAEFLLDLETKAFGKCIGEYVYHPLIWQFLNDPSQDEETKTLLRDSLVNAAIEDRDTYGTTVRILQPYCEAKGLDKTSARKQARGAARGSLGNALATEMIYTTSYQVWKDIIFKQRASDFADAEIRLVMQDIVAIAHSVDPSYFPSPDEMVPASDGIGKCLPR